MDDVRLCESQGIEGKMSRFDGVVFSEGFS